MSQAALNTRNHEEEASSSRRSNGTRLAGIVFLLAVLFYGEVPGADKMVTFAFIWVALAVFIVDALYTQRRLRRA